VTTARPSRVAIDQPAAGRLQRSAAGRSSTTAARARHGPTDPAGSRRIASASGDPPASLSGRGTGAAAASVGGRPDARSRTTRMTALGGQASRGAVDQT
jgi:hypothetical protein